MKRTITLFALFFIAGSIVFSQGLRRPNRPTVNINPSPGFITINEIIAAYGLAGSSTPYAKNFFGITSLNGYQVNETFMVGAGTGLLFYNDGLLIPLYVDMRIRIMLNDFTPYLSGAGGLLLNPADFDSGSRMFINPSAGVRYTVNRNLGITLGAGLWIQMAPNIGRASFINARSGVVYKF